jgi:hypothetical protein
MKITGKTIVIAAVVIGGGYWAYKHFMKKGPAVPAAAVPMPAAAAAPGAPPPMNITGFSPYTPMYPAGTNILSNYLQPGAAQPSKNIMGSAPGAPMPVGMLAKFAGLS